MTSALTYWRAQMNSYDNEGSGSPDTFPCTPVQSGLMVAGAFAFYIAPFVAFLYFILSRP